MASTILFSNLNRTVPVNELPATVIKFLHGLHAIDTALSIFLSAVNSDNVDGTDDFLAIFDAHVGDCSCHMRAQMLWELLEHARAPGNNEWMRQMVVSVQKSTSEAVLLLENIRARKGRLRGLDLGPVSTLTEARIFDKIDGDKFMALLDDTSTNSTSSNDYLATPEDNPPSVLSNEKAGLDFPEAVRLASERLIISRRYITTADVSTDSDVSSRSSTSKRKYRTVDGDEWDLKDRTMIIRFLVISRLLSLKKEMFLEPGPPAYIRARTNPTAVYSDTEAQLLKALPEVHIGPKERTGKLMLVKEHERMQSYLSQLTANWSSTLAADVFLSRSAENLVRRSTVTNSRQISCVPSYTSFLPIREEWLTSRTPILLLVRRFCNKGYHTSFYRVKSNPSGWDSVTASRRISLMGHTDWFTVDHVSLGQVLLEPWAQAPHFIYVSNSIDGSLSDFYDRLVDANQHHQGSHAPHNDDSCLVHLAHVKAIVEHNFSRAATHFFSQHGQYPFQLSGGRDGHEFVGNLIRETLGEQAETAFRDVASCNDHSGTASTRLHTCMHAYLELAVVVGRQVDEQTRKSEKPAPFGYTWTT